MLWQNSPYGRTDCHFTSRDARQIPPHSFSNSGIALPHSANLSQAVYEWHYGSAILEAFKEINIRVKELAGREGSRDDGTSLMGKVFGGANPILRFNSGQTESHKNEQEGFALVFKGSMMGIRNPKAHDRMVEIEEDRAFEYLALASLLMRRLDDAAALGDSEP